MVIFERLAGLLLPADGSGAVLETDDDWQRGLDAIDGHEVVVWGRPPLASGAGALALARFGRNRRRALARLHRSPGPTRLDGVIRWRPPEIAPSRLKQPLKEALASGAAVTLSVTGPVDRALDAAWRAAGFTGRSPAPVAASGGSLRIEAVRAGERVVFRAGLEGSPVDPTRAATALRSLAQNDVVRVPRVLGSGATAGAGWSVETRLDGSRPPALTTELLADVRAFCTALPRASGPPRAFGHDAATVRAALPRFASALDDLVGNAAENVKEFPSVARHGDLWLANLLERDGRLVGVVDWDAGDPSGVPGTDLLHLEAARGERGSLGARFARAPWRSESFVAGNARYWRVFDIDAADPDVGRAIGVAWWVGQIAANLERLPHLADREGWVGENVGAVLARA